MNNKGFTLIELIMVVTVLAMIALLSTPGVIKYIEKNKVDNYNNTIDSIIEATKLYVSDNRYDLDFDGNCIPGDNNEIATSVTLENLITNNNIGSSVKNFCTNEEIDNGTIINISFNCKTKQFSYDLDLKNKGADGVPLNGTVLLSLDGVTKSNGKIADEKTCDDLYG